MVVGAAVVLLGSGLIVLFNIFGWGQPDDREVRISWGADLSSDFDLDIRDWCLGFVFCRDFSYELSGDFDPAPYTLECWVGSHRVAEPYSWSGPEYPKNGCRAKGNHLIVAYVVVDGVKSNELRWDQPDDGQPDDGEGQPDGREVRISVGTDASGRSECPQGAVCRNYHYELTGFDPAPYTLECWTNGRLIWSGNWSGRSETGCYSWGSGQTVHVVVDSVKSNELLWGQ